MPTYWTFNNTNGLKGVESTTEESSNCSGGVITHPDPDNPLILTDQMIIYALQTSRRARDDFRRVFPTLLPEEQDRLSTLLEQNPRASMMLTDEQVITDRITAHGIRTIPVRTVGRRGGKGFGGGR